MTWRSSTRVVAAAVAALSGLGYLSNISSFHACEARAATALVAAVGERNVYQRTHRPSVRGSVLSAAGFVVRECPPSQVNGVCFPWIELAPAQSVLPFVSSVRWGAADGPLAGAGGTTRFLCVFGWVVDLGDHRVWVS